MINKTVSSIGFDLGVNVPETIDEYDALAKKAGAALESAVFNVLYRSTLAKFRAAFSEAVENNTGIPRKTEVITKMDGTAKIDEESGEPMTRYIETENEYFKRVLAQLVLQGAFPSTEAAAASFQTLAQSTMDSIPFDPSETERAPSGPRTVAKAYIKLAEQAEKSGKLAALAQQLSEKLGATWHVEVTVDSVARAVSEDQRRKRERESLTAEYSV
jgi:hypothetical protein